MLILCNTKNASRQKKTKNEDVTNLFFFNFSFLSAYLCFKLIVRYEIHPTHRSYLESYP